jgi:hypothetical protein
VDGSSGIGEEGQKVKDMTDRNKNETAGNEAKNERTEIVVLMDASGSMNSIREDAVGGFNSFIEKQKEQDGEANITVTFFDSNRYTKWLEGIDLKACPVLNGEYRPGAATPLLDATGRTIEELEARLAGLDAAVQPARVMVIVVTDGQENSSRFFTREQVKRRIEEKQEAAGWQFVFLAANVDAFDEGRQMGFPKRNTAGYKSTRKGTRKAFDAMSKAVLCYRDVGTVENLGCEIEEDD